ncbi:unnamed protein product [Closterium sp. NIES-54]
MSAVDLDHALRSASVMYADDSSVEHSGYYSCLFSLGAVEVASAFPASIACTGLTTGVVSLSFTLDLRASNCFFRDYTDLTPLRTPVFIALADSTAGPVVACSTTTLLCPTAPSGFLTGYYTPSFSRNLVGVSHLHNLGVVTTFPLVEPAAYYTVGVTGAPLATFHREPGSGLYSLHTGSHHSGQVRSGQVAAVSCDCRSLTHPSVLWHHRLGHPSFLRLSRMVRHRLVSLLPESLAPLPRSPAPLCTPCIEGWQRAAPHFSSFPPTTAPLQTLHLDVWGPFSVLGPRQERYLLIVEDDFSRYTTVFPLRRKAGMPTVLEPWLLARGGAQGLCGLRLHSDRCVRYTAHQLNLWPGDARPRVVPFSLWTGSSGVAADFRVWGSLAHVRAPGVNKLSPRTRACIFLGFPLDASGWVFYDPITYQLFASLDIMFDESVCYYRSRPHQGTEVFSPPLFLTLEPPPVAPGPVPVVPGGAGGAVAEGEGTGAAGAGGVGFGDARGVGVEVTPMEDMAASSQRPRPASPPGFPSVPQFPPRSSLRPVAAELGVVPAGGTGGPRGVSGGSVGSGGVGVGGTSNGTAAAAAAGAVSVAAVGESRGGFTAVVGESRGGVTTAAVGAVTAAAGESRGGVTSAAVGAGAFAAGERRGGVTAAPQEGRAGVPPAAEGAVTDTIGESRGVTAAAGEGSAGVLVAAAGAVAAAAGEGRGRATRAAAGAGTIAVGTRGGGAAATTHRSPLSRAVSPEPCRSRYRADGPFHLILRSRVPPPPVLPQPPDLSLTVLHDPLSDYLRASRPLVSRVLSALVTLPTTPLSSVSPLVTTVAGFASSHRIDYVAHLLSGAARTPSSGGAPVFPLDVIEDR